MTDSCERNPTGGLWGPGMESATERERLVASIRMLRTLEDQAESYRAGGLAMRRRSLQKRLAEVDGHPPSDNGSRIFPCDCFSCRIPGYPDRGIRLPGHQPD